MISVYGDDFPFMATSANITKPRHFPRLSAAVDDAIQGRICVGAHFRTSCLTGVEVGRAIACLALLNFMHPIPRLHSSKQPDSGEFHLHLTTGLAVPYIIETSANLSEWTPWQTNYFGTILQPATNAATVDHRFFRSRLQFP
jgi:hypothetical protein